MGMSSKKKGFDKLREKLTNIALSSKEFRDELKDAVGEPISR